MQEKENIVRFNLRNRDKRTSNKEGIRNKFKRKKNNNNNNKINI